MEAVGFHEEGRLEGFLDREYAAQRVLPVRRSDVFRAFALTPFDCVKVVIIGQDPYPNPVNAMGLAFSVRSSVRPLPLSLRNIDHELQTDMRIDPARSGDLTVWAKRGVLLLNRALTIGIDRTSHARQWRGFTNAVIDCLLAHPSELVFILWGSKAQGLAGRIRRCGRHHLVCGSHPVRDAFFGGRYFSRANRYLGSTRHIDWSR
jgi:uracil-DNA glycosylase